MISRNALAITMGLLGLVAGAAAFIGIMVLGSYFADARTQNIAGPGVDVFLRTPFPTPRSEIILDVEARGGSAAGIEEVVVATHGVELARLTGAGATWGEYITSRSRGSDTAQMRFPVPESLAVGDTLSIDIQVSYTVALSEHLHEFSNDSRASIVSLLVPILSASAARTARIERVAIACGGFVIWFLVVVGVTVLYKRAGDAEGVEKNLRELEGIGLGLCILSTGMFGYWTSVRVLMNALGFRSGFAGGVISVFWTAAPLVWSFRYAYRRRVERAQHAALLALLQAVQPPVPVARDPEVVNTGLQLSLCRAQLDELVSTAPSLRSVMAWVEAAQSQPQTDVMRQIRASALFQTLRDAYPVLSRPRGADRVPAAREDLVFAIEQTITLASALEETRLAERVRDAVTALR